MTASAKRRNMPELALRVTCLAVMVFCGSGCAIGGGQTAGQGVARAAIGLEPVETIALWSGAVPGSPQVLPNEQIVARTNAFGLTDRAAHNVARPTLGLFRPSQSNGGAILIIPGGGYSWVVMDKEGYEGAAYFSARGYTVYVLRYRLPHQGWSAGPDTPLQDAQRAIRLIRARATQDAVDPQRIAVMGFSAGGHVAGSLASRFDAVISPPLDAIDAISARPDLAVLMYPVVTMKPPFAHAKSRENMLGQVPSLDQVSRYSLEASPNPLSPPTFLLHAYDDGAVPVENTLMLQEALHQAKVPVATHLFEKGGHGFGLRGIEGTPLAAWPDLVITWAASKGFPAPYVPRDRAPASSTSGRTGSIVAKSQSAGTNGR